jgi:hypothetical protein
MSAGQASPHPVRKCRLSAIDAHFDDDFHRRRAKQSFGSSLFKGHRPPAPVC